MYPQKEFGDSSIRRFKPSWFNDFSNWLEYSIAKDALFCFYCYLFKPNSEEHGGGDSFVDGGFSNWKKKGRLQTHIGKSGSALNQARIKYEAQGLSFRGNDESEDSRNQGNFLELLKWLCDHNNEIKADIVSVIAFETLNVIMKDIGDVKEQMPIVLRYVNKKGRAMERFIGIEHVSSTTALSLRDAIDHLFSRFNLSISSLRDQGYGGANNMRVTLAIVAVANKHADIETFFNLVNKVVNVVGGSAEKKRLEVVESLNIGEISSGKGLNQETDLNLILMFSAIVDVIEMIATMILVVEREVKCSASHEKGIGYNIDVLNMDDIFMPLGRSRCNNQGMTNLHHFRVDFFYAIIDLQIQELNDHFPKLGAFKIFKQDPVITFIRSEQ
ncbi:zinc finger MYM-type protein 1-like [Olea europaea var. sylvestris]|uniref:zinc finger MYM-type protein 1-like n=1 Tax=Olea europaea var. sylvestris TaxID=158386 RepID=UPI000C1D8C20|nr:zinc finger MYM-type protein 1-like [Olea europaea var. sylvestris]